MTSSSADVTAADQQRVPGLMPRALLGQRYRLIRPVDALLGSEAAAPEASWTQLWRAEDETLARPVAVRVMVLVVGDARLAVLRRQFLDAAVTAGRLAHPCLARVYDASDERAALDDGSLGDVAYVVSEWVDGRTLTTALRDGPLTQARAVAVLREACDGLAAAHDAGIVHGHLHPGNVMISTNGQVKVTDTAVAAALAGISEGSQGTRPDVRDLGRVLYAALTAKWPRLEPPAVDEWKGLPEAPRSSGHVCAPRQVTAGIAKNLDQVVTRTVEPERAAGNAITTVRSFASALPEAESLVPLEKARVTKKRERVEAGERRRVPWWVWLTTAVAVWAVFAGSGYVLGEKVGTVPETNASKLQSISSGTQAGSKTTNGPGSQILVGPAAVTSFDPPPGDGTEDDTLLGNVVDGSVDTPWETETYSTARFGNLKPGVGFVVDLGSSTNVGTVSIILANGVTDIQLRASDTPSTATLDGFKVVAEASDADKQVTLKGDGTTARYWLVWITSLPAAPKGGGFRASIDEVTFRR